MVDSGLLPYAPDYVVPPGETVLETIETLGMSQTDLALRTGLTTKTVNEIIKGKAPVSASTALNFERVLGVPAGFWMNLERQYREALARRKEGKDLGRDVDWLKRFPVRDMIRKGWIAEREERVAQLQELLCFFGVASPETWRAAWEGPDVAFRQSPAFRASPEAVAAWLRRGILGAQAIDCKPFDRSCFLESLAEIRALTPHVPDTFEPQMRNLCAQSGVAVVFVPELPRTITHGATSWLSPGKAMIELSLRHGSDDQFWFTFFHESGHLVCHGKKEGFVDAPGVASKSEDECEANRFAEDFLIPRHEWERFIRTGFFGSTGIGAFARRVGIAPGIVVGRLQHERRIPMSHFNGLKRRFKLVEAEESGK